MIRLPRTAIMILAAGITTITFVGCESNKYLRINEIRKNPSPEMNTMARTSDNRKNDHAVLHNINARQISDDIDALLLLDRPSRLTPFVIPQ